jgi:hypothetical protein
MSRKLKEDEFSDSDLFLKEEKSSLDINQNGNDTDNFVFSESSLPALEPSELMRFVPSVSKASNDLLLLDTEDEEQRKNAVQGYHVSPVALDEISYAERSTDSHGLSNETKQNENIFSTGKKFSPISSFIVEEHQKDHLLLMDRTNDTMKTDDKFNTKLENNSEIYPSSYDQLLDTTDVLSMIEEEISTNVSDSPHSYTKRTY